MYFRPLSSRSLSVIGLRRRLICAPTDEVPPCITSFNPTALRSDW